MVEDVITFEVIPEKPVFEIVGGVEMLTPQLDWRELLDQHIKAALNAKPTHSWSKPQYGSRIHELLVPQELSLDMAIFALMHDLNEDFL